MSVIILFLIALILGAYTFLAAYKASDYLFKEKVISQREEMMLEDRAGRLLDFTKNEKILELYLFVESPYAGSAVYRPYKLLFKGGIKNLGDDVTLEHDRVAFRSITVNSESITNFALNRKEFCLMDDTIDFICQDEFNDFISKKRDRVALYAIVKPETIEELSTIINNTKR